MGTGRQNQQLTATGRTGHRRLRDRGRTGRDGPGGVLRTGSVCRPGAAAAGTPMAVPAVYGVGFAARTLYVHGSLASRGLAAEPDATVCVTVTYVDGPVPTRSVFEHGVGHRGAVVFGVPRLITRRTGPGALPHGCASPPDTARPARGAAPAAPTSRSRPPFRCSRRRWSWTRPR
ncbi:pyridoxamine 5'-phosphate oxidase family protein [Streptomyces enissocaesilis]